MQPAELKPYPAYKDSGVPWLGEVPAHWEVRRVRSIAEVINGATPASNRPEYWEGDISWLTPEDLGQLTSRYVNISARRITNEGYHACGTTLAPAGSLAISTRAPIGHIAILFSAACVNQGCRLLVPTETVQSGYLYYELEVVRPELESLGQGSTFTELSRAKLAGFTLAVPPLPEQTAIVRFLDHADRRIRRYIRAKQKLMGLLEEQKQALIHQAVTGQIDVHTGQPYPAYKPSGVEWLGEMPAHWDEISLGRCLRRIAQGWSPTAAEGEIEPNQWSVLTLSSVKRGMFDATAIKPIPISAKIPEGIEIEDGDLLLTRSNTRELVGDVCIVEGARLKTVISDLIYRLTPEPAILERRFLMFQLLSTLGRRQIERDARGSSGTMPKITQRHIRSWRVLIPPLEEQHYIVKIIKDTEKTINNAVKGVRAELSLLREYRTRLIADVVTGKLDVREAVAALPEVDPLAAEETLNDTLDTDAV